MGKKGGQENEKKKLPWEKKIAKQPGSGTNDAEVGRLRGGGVRQDQRPTNVRPQKPMGNRRTNEDSESKCAQVLGDMLSAGKAGPSNWTVWGLAPQNTHGGLKRTTPRIT